MKKIPTVSQVINASRSQKRLDFLSKWGEKNGDFSKDGGNIFHKNVEDYLLKGLIPNGCNFFNNIYPYLRNYKSSGLNIIVEKPFICEDLYRGRIDLLFDNTLFEFKTRNTDNSLHPDTEKEYLMQLSAYTNAFSDQIEESCLVIIYPFQDRKPDFLFYSKEYLQPYFNLFTKALEKCQH